MNDDLLDTSETDEDYEYTDELETDTNTGATADDEDLADATTAEFSRED